MIPIDEQIASQKHLLKNHSGNGYDIDAAILASLERLKAIESVQVPEEPEWLKYYRTEVECGNLKDYKQFINHIDTLRDLLKREGADKERLYQLNIDCEAVIIRQREERKSAEAKLAAMLKLGEEPSEEIRRAMIKASNDIATYKDTFKAGFAKLIEQAGVKK